MKPSLESPVTELKGVGPKSAERLARVGHNTIGDLLHYYPRDYQDRGNVKKVGELEVGEFVTLKGEVRAKRLRRAGFRKTVLEVLVGDETGVVAAVWFNLPYLAKQFEEGARIILYGEVGYFRRLQIVSPQFEFLTDDEPEGEPQASIVPVYPLTESLRQSTIRTLAAKVVKAFVDQVPELHPGAVLRELDLLPAVEAVRNVHFPQSAELKDRARRRLAYDEFFLLELGMALRRRAIKDDSTGNRLLVGPNVDTRIRGLFPFELTQAQERVIDEITEDLTSDRPMNRLLQGDVGSGKTVVAAYALLAAIANGYQAALMAPTEILAEQHYLTFRRLLHGASTKLALLSSGLAAKDRRQMLESIGNGETDLVIGTHALIQEDVDFRQLGVVVVDEQHKFGVLQRANLIRKGLTPDVLIMTATPIPRTMSLTVFGDLDVSTIDELPPGRKPVKTVRYPQKESRKAFDLVQTEVASGRQAFLVYPLVEDSDKLELSSVVEMTRKHQTETFPNCSVGMLHGQMKTDEKDQMMADFRDGKYQILVATVVVEVGIDVPNASVMLIEHAERYGLAQLHQLRGRVGRGPHDSCCVLVGDPKTEEARRRLEIITSTSDGFEIAEEDLRLRGPGEFFGTKQHGLPELKIGNIAEDFGLLRKARDHAFALVAADPTLAKPENQAAKQCLRQKFRDRMGLVSVG